MKIAQGERSAALGKRSIFGLAPQRGAATSMQKAKNRSMRLHCQEVSGSHSTSNLNRFKSAPTLAIHCPISNTHATEAVTPSAFPPRLSILKCFLFSMQTESFFWQGKCNIRM
jgi:hypothetical protein